MHRFALIVMAGILSAGWLMGTEKPAAKAAKASPTGKASPPAKAAPLPPGLPAGAKQIAPYRFRYVDAQGKAWVYTQTPFGFSRGLEEEVLGQSPDADEGILPYLKAKRNGEMVEFERTTPFGKSAWKKKATELTEEEKSWLEKLEKRGQ